MTRDDFIKNWKTRVAGMALFGVWSETRDGPVARAGKILEIPGEVEKLLGAMWDSIQPAKDVKPVNNGTPAQGVRK